MSTLREPTTALSGSMRRLGEEVVSYFADAGPGTAAPYLVYVYPPQQEFRVRGELGELKLWIEAQEVACFHVSLAELFWQAVDEAGFADQIVAEEEQAPGDLGSLANVQTSISQILTGPPSLADRVLQVLQDVPTRSAAFLYRAGALYPCYRTSAILDDLRERVDIPVVLLYPGGLEGSYGLRFMDRCAPAHGYRAKIIARETL